MHPTTRPRVSVVIPVKDDATLLDGCLASLRAQTRPPDEIVVVDNGSQDASAAVGRRGGARIVPCARPGIPAASAAGLDAATGDVLLRLDADCRAPADWIERMTAAVADRRVGAATGGARFDSAPPWAGRWAARGYLGAYAVVCGAALGHRPLFGSNIRRGLRTVLVRWPHDLPPIRVTRIGLRRLRRARAQARRVNPAPMRARRGILGPHE